MTSTLVQIYFPALFKESRGCRWMEFQEVRKIFCIFNEKLKETLQSYFAKSMKNITSTGRYLGQWRSQGGTRRTFPPPRNGKNWCRKMMLFPKALFLATNFPQLAKNSILLLHFYQKFSKFSQTFPGICFSSKRAKN